MKKTKITSIVEQLNNGFSYWDECPKRKAQRTMKALQKKLSTGLIVLNYDENAQLAHFKKIN